MNNLYLYHVDAKPTCYGEHYIVLPLENVTHSMYHGEELFDHWGHNPNGVSIIFENKVAWAHDGTRVFDTEEFCKAHGLSPEETLLFHLYYGEELPLSLDDVHPDHNPLLKYTPIIMED